MKIAFRDFRGKYGTTWDGQTLVFDRDAIGAGETFEMVVLDGPTTQVDPPKPAEPAYPLYSDYIGRERDWFSMRIFGKPFGRQALLDLEPTLKANGWELTPPNANGERTKVGYPIRAGVMQWVRVGFGEGHWVWIPQPL